MRLDALDEFSQPFKADPARIHFWEKRKKDDLVCANAKTPERMRAILDSNLDPWTRFAVWGVAMLDRRQAREGLGPWGARNSERSTIQKCKEMNKKEVLTSAMTVKDVLDCHPEALQVFVDIGLLCVGCPAEAFHTLADVAREYHLDLSQLLQRLHKAIGDDAIS